MGNRRLVVLPEHEGEFAEAPYESLGGSLAEVPSAELCGSARRQNTGVLLPDKPQQAGTGNEMFAAVVISLEAVGEKVKHSCRRFRAVGSRLGDASGLCNWGIVEEGYNRPNANTGKRPPRDGEEDVKLAGVLAFRDFTSHLVQRLERRCALVLPSCFENGWTQLRRHVCCEKANLALKLRTCFCS